MKDNFNKESYDNAIHFFDQLAGLMGKEKVNESIECIFCEHTAEVPRYTFFLGKKQEKATVVFYPDAVMENGIPRAVIYIEGAEGLHSILQEFFIKQWNIAKQTLNQAG